MKVDKRGRGRLQVGNSTAAILAGKDDLTTWTDEELERGQRRMKNGRFPTRRPVVIAKAVHDELVTRKMQAAYDLLKTSTYDAVAVLVSIAKDKKANKMVRVRAAELILDRTLGKATQTVNLQGDPAWQKVFVEAIVGSEAQAVAEDEDIVEGEIVE